MHCEAKDVLDHVRIVREHWDGLSLHTPMTVIGPPPIGKWSNRFTRTPSHSGPRTGYKRERTWLEDAVASRQSIFASLQKPSKLRRISN